MYAKACLLLAIVLHAAVVSESRWIAPPTRDEYAGNEEIPFSMNPLETETCRPNEVYSDCVNPCNDCQTRNIPCNFLVCNKGCDCKPGYTRNDQRICIPEYQCSPGKRSDSPADYDDYVPKVDDSLPGTGPEKFPPGGEPDKIPQENPKENDGIDKIGDENFREALDKEDSDELGNNDKDFGPSLDEDIPINKDGDELEIEDVGPEQSEEGKKDKDYRPEEEKSDEEKREEEENKEEPDEEKEEDNQEESDEEKEGEELDEEKLDEEKEEGEELDEEKFDEEKKKEEENEEKLDEEKEEEDQEKPDEAKEEELDEEKPDEGKEDELDDEKPDEEKVDELDEEKLDEKRKEEEEKHELETDDDKKHVTKEPIDEDNEEEKIAEELDEETNENDSKNEDGIPQKGDGGLFKGGSIFDTPFFNIEKIKNYFSKLDRVLGHTFQQTIDDALQRNDTSTNTTEEEVDIDGKKYIVSKSVIKGADNHSSLYIESLSAKPKTNDTEGMKDIEIKNLTQT